MMARWRIAGTGPTKMLRRLSIVALSVGIGLMTLLLWNPPEPAIAIPSSGISWDTNPIAATGSLGVGGSATVHATVTNLSGPVSGATVSLSFSGAGSATATGGGCAAVSLN